MVGTLGKVLENKAGRATDEDESDEEDSDIKGQSLSLFIPFSIPIKE